MDDEVKSIFLSKTLWANLIALGVTFLGAHHVVVDPDTQAELVAGVMAGVNIVLRCFTKLPVNVTGASVIAPFFIVAALVSSLIACSGDPAKDAATFQSYVVAYTPIVDDGLCRAQALANSAGAVAAASGDAAGAADASLASQSAGAGCYALKPVAVPASTAAAPAP